MLSFIDFIMIRGIRFIGNCNANITMVADNNCVAHALKSGKSTFAKIHIIPMHCIFRKANRVKYKVTYLDII